MNTPRYSEEELKVLLAKYSEFKRREHGQVGVGITGRSAQSTPATPINKAPDKARAPFRSRLEQAYAGYLHVLMLGGDIQRYAYEPIRLNLAPKTTLTPDFLVVSKDGSIEFHETKGWARDDAMAKLKIAARLYPQWKFWLVKRKRGIWEQRELPI